MDSHTPNTKKIATASLPPPQPIYILRGHSSPIHSLHFLQNNLQLISGDADGNIVVWDLTMKRPLAVWRPHEGSILGLGIWAKNRLITHGRDNHLRIWSLNDITDPSAGYSTILPAEPTTQQRKQPWLLHSLIVSTINFCAFAGVEEPKPTVPENRPSADTEDNEHPIDESSYLIATPGANDSTVTIHSLPSEKAIALIPAQTLTNGRAGMVMALALTYITSTLHLAVGYESGLTILYRQSTKPGIFDTLYSARPHTEPILSLSVSLLQNCYFTSSADSVIVKHPLYPAQGTIKEVKTGHAGQQSLRVRGDGKILATAGWDGRARVYGVKGVVEKAVLKWHKEGVYAVDFGSLGGDAVEGDRSEQGPRGGDGVLTVKEQRERRTRETHWLAVGGKDGKVSLWDVF